MPRKLHKWYIGAILHVTARGNHKSDIFKEETDYKLYLNYIKEAMEYYENKHQIIAYALMTNHIHLVIETTDLDISDFIKRAHSRYAGNFNKKYNYIGHLFQGRYKSELIEDDKYMLEVSRYVHLNPVRSKMVEKPGDYRWSSYSMYTGEKDEKLITSKRVLSYFNTGEEKGLYKKFVESAMGSDPWVNM